jgi:hypothetical protein
MPISELPPYFLPLFVGAFLGNAAYIVCLFGLKLRLAARDYAGVSSRLAGESPIAMFKVLAFAFSGRHIDLDDRLISRLTWGTRVFLIIGGALTGSAFVLFAGSV